MSGGDASRPHALARLRSLLRRQPGLLWWPVLIVVLAGSSFLIFWQVDPDAEDLPSRLLGELGSALLGSAIVAVAAGFGYYLTQTQNRRQRREQRQAAARIQEAVKDRQLRIGGMTIPHVVVLQASQPSRPYTDHVEVVFTKSIDGPRISEEVHDAFAARRQARQRDAERDEKIFDDGQGVDLVDVDLTGRGRPPDNQLTYLLTWANLSYHDWAVTSDRLDTDLGSDEVVELGRLGIAPRSEGTTLRSMMSDPEVRDLHALTRDCSPWPAKVGSGVAVVTSDSQVLLGLRARATFVASDDGADSLGRRRVHVVAEGVEPGDLEYDGDSPKRAASRALAQEFGLGAGASSTGDVQWIVPTSFFIDTQRLQPCFGYVALAESPASDIIGALPCARESWEADDVIAMPLDDDSTDLVALLCDRHPAYVLASNHAKAYLYFAMQTMLGYGHMRHLLRDTARR